MLEEHARNAQNPFGELPDPIEELQNPIINLEEILRICDFLKINSNTLSEAYGELQGLDKSRNSISYIGSWVNANEIKSTTVAAILKLIITATIEVTTLSSSLRTDCVKLRDLQSDSQGIINKHQDSIQNLMDRTTFLENKADQNLSNSFGFTNDRVQALETNLGSRLEEISRRLDDVVLQQRDIIGRVGELGEQGSIHERRLLELNDKVKQSMREINDCTATAAKSLETSAQSFSATRELQTESMRASRTVQQATQEALASLNERIDKQDSEIRSLRSVRQPIDYEGFLDRQRLEGDRTNDKTAELLAQLQAAYFEISNTRTEVSRKLQEISDSHGTDYRSFERVMANLSDGLQTCQSDLHKLRAETAQSVNELVSRLATNARPQPEADHHTAGIKSLVTSLESRLQSIAELVKDKLDASRFYSVLTDLQTQRSNKMQETCQPDNLTAIISRSEGLTTEILDLKKKIAETLSETNEVKTETLKCLIEVRAIETRLKSGAQPAEAVETRI